MVTDFKKNRKKNIFGYFLLRLGGLLVVCVVVALAVANVKIYQKRQEFSRQVASLEQQIQDIKNRNNDLEQDVKRANDDQYIEKVAREELDLQKPGEQAVSFVMPKTPEKKDDEGQNIAQGWLGWLSGSWQWLKEKF